MGGLEKMLTRLLGVDVHMELRTTTGSGFVRVDPGQLEQVILNLAMNARDAMPQGGRLAIQVDDREVFEEETAGRPGLLPGSYVLIRVSDTGVGMDAQQAAHAFEPFFTTKEAGAGTGLGLASVYGIVKQSQGWIYVDSELGRGTCFSLYLPRWDEADARRQTLPEQPSAPGGSETVLLVEAEQELRRGAGRVLRRAGYAVIEAANAGEALLALEQHPGAVHLLVSDVAMPRLSGPELALRLRAEQPQLKALFISGRADEALIAQALAIGTSAFLAKPFTRRALELKVRELLDG